MTLARTWSVGLVGSHGRDGRGRGRHGRRAARRRRWSACPTPSCTSRSTGSAPPWSTPGATLPPRADHHRPVAGVACPSRAAASTSRSRSPCSPRPARVPRALGRPAGAARRARPRRLASGRSAGVLPAVLAAARAGAPAGGRAGGERRRGGAGRAASRCCRPRRWPTSSAHLRRPDTARPRTCAGRCRRAPPGPDLADVVGQAAGRRAVEVAAAGGHHLFLTGPPGAGKTMLAERLPGLLPPLDEEAALEVTAIHSVAGTLPPARRWSRRPTFEAPHHSATMAALVGGGSGQIRPGALCRGAPRRAVPRRGAGVPAGGARHAAPAAGARVGDHPPRRRGRRPFPCRAQLVLAANPCPCATRGRRHRLHLQRRWSGGATSPGCPARCWTASTCGSTCRRSPGPPGSTGSGTPEPTAAVAARVRDGPGRRGRAAGRDRAVG